MQLSTPAPNTITQSLTATGTIQWAAGSLFYLPEGLLVEAVFVSEGEAVQEGDKIAALRREDVEQKLRSLQAELAQKQTEYASAVYLQWSARAAWMKFWHPPLWAGNTL